jgi:predicted transcriptional regulator of viral defense system
MKPLTVDERVSSFATLHHGVFRLEDLHELKVTRAQRRRRVATGHWKLLYDDVYCIAGAPTSWTSELLAAVWAGGARAVASHRSAAALWEVPGGRRDRVEITCPRWRRAQEPGLIVHESRVLQPADVAERQGIPVTTIERTIFDLAAVAGFTTVDLAIDNALRRQLTDLQRLGETLRRLARRGRAGTQRFRQALAERSPETALSESERERLLFRMLARHGFPAPVPQYEIRDETGNVIARPDFAYPDLRIAIEYDSFQEHTGTVALVHDSARRNAMVALGWAPIAATVVDLRRGGNQLADALRRARNGRQAELASQVVRI